MHEELMKVPTTSLVEMLLVILTCERTASANDATAIKQIQCELQRRGEEQHWSFSRVH